MIEITQASLDKVLVDINSVSTHTVTGKITKPVIKSANDYIELDSKEFHGIVENLGDNTLYCLYHKKYDITSIHKTNIFEAFSDIVLQLKAKIKEYQEALKEM